MTQPESEGKKERESEIDAWYPKGAVARIENSPRHREFMSKARPSTICIPITAARSLLADGYTADEWTPEETRVMTTSTIPDGRLKTLDIESEIEIVTEFGSDVHIGGDVAVYEGWPRWARKFGSELLIKNSIYIEDKTPDDVTVIPLVKGVTMEERDWTYRGLGYFPHNVMCFYGTQYFSAGVGNNKSLAKERLESIGREARREVGEDVEIVVMGWVSDALSEVDAPVVAAAGLNVWQQSVNWDADPTPEFLRKVWGEVDDKVKGWLGIKEEIKETTFAEFDVDDTGSSDSEKETDEEPPDPASTFLQKADEIESVMESIE